MYPSFMGDPNGRITFTEFAVAKPACNPTAINAWSQQFRGVISNGEDIHMGWLHERVSTARASECSNTNACSH